MKISPSKIISLLFFIFSGFYLYTAHQIQVFAFDENAAFNAKPFPIYLGYAGLIFSALYVLLPETRPSNVDLTVLELLSLHLKVLFLVKERKVQKILNLHSLSKLETVLR